MTRCGSRSEPRHNLGSKRSSCSVRSKRLERLEQLERLNELDSTKARTYFRQRRISLRLRLTTEENRSSIRFGE